MTIAHQEDNCRAEYETHDFANDVGTSRWITKGMPLPDCEYHCGRDTRFSCRCLVAWVAAVRLDVRRDPKWCRSVQDELEQADEVGLKAEDEYIVKGAISIYDVCHTEHSRAMSERENPNSIEKLPESQIVFLVDVFLQCWNHAVYACIEESVGVDEVRSEDHGQSSHTNDNLY